MGAVLFLAAWLIPNHYPPWVGFHNEAAMFAALLLLCGVAAFNPHSICLPRATVAIFSTLMALIWVQWAIGLIFFSGDALVSSIYLLAICLAWWLGAQTASVSDDFERTFDWAAALMVIAACASSFMAILQWLNLEQEFARFVAEHGSNRPYANLGQPNLLATLLVMGQVCAYALFVRQRLKAWHLIAISCLLSVGVIATESRAGLLSAFFVGIFLIVRTKPVWQIGGFRIVAGWWAMLIVLAIIWRPVTEFFALQNPREIALSLDHQRITIWKQVIAGLHEAPWLGYGWRQTAVAQTVGAEFVPGDNPIDYAHNAVLDILVWLGLPLGILALTLGAWWLWHTVRNIKNATECLMFSATIPFLVHSMVEYPFAYAYFLIPVAWIYGVLQAQQTPGRFRVLRGVPWPVKLPMIAGLIGFAALCSVIALEYFDAEEDYRVLRFEMRNLGSRARDYQAPSLTFLTQLDDFLKMGRMEPARNMSTVQIEQLRKSNLIRHWGVLHMKYVVALGINGQPAEASRQLRNIKALYGPEPYRSAVDEFRTLRDEKYPELALVKID